VNVSVVARHMEVTDAMRSYAEQKVSRLPRFFNGLQSAVVTLDLDAGQHLVEIVASASHKAVFVARHRGNDMYACVDQCIHKLRQQLRRHKDRVRDRQGPSHEQTMMPERPPKE
jgi:putative sigma-54 modulation protein